MTSPLITIGITAYNAAATIERALYSALAQTWRPIEIVAVDDCSTDGTKEILDRLAAQCPEVRVFGNTINGGVAVSRNHILAEARGEFVAFFDDDDESLPERIMAQFERIVELEQNYPAGMLAVCHTARRLVYPHGEERIAPTMGQNESEPVPAGMAVVRRILLGTHVVNAYGGCPTASQMARLSTYRAVGGFDSSLRRSEDTDFNIRLAAAGGYFVGIARPLVIQTMTRTSEKSLAEEYRNMVLLIEKHRGFLEQEGQFVFCRSWMDMKQAWLERRYGVFVRRMVLLAMRNPGLTVRRLVTALPNMGLNRAFSRFHTHGNILAKP